MKSTSFYTLIFALITCLNCFAGKKPSIGKAPGWITSNPIQFSATQLDGEALDGYIDLLFEKQTNLAEQSVYYKQTFKILTEAGIQNNSEVSVNFDPTYQQLTFHEIKIIRGNLIINQLNLSKIKTIQKEEELDMFSYDGSLTSILILDDVRKGDIVEYSYTISGFNPVFKGKFSNVYDLNFKVPVYNVCYKLIVPYQKEISVRNSNTRISPVINQLNGESVYEWKLDNINPLRTENGTPSWYDPYSTAQISEYKTWTDVNNWAMELFPQVKDLSSSLQNKIAEIKSSNPTEEQRILATLRFVQDDIRYMGIEIGVNSHKPNHPNKIFAQRYGDCKDKSHLLCTMLRSMGIEAYPVLINTNLKKTIKEWLPDPAAFDHVTVQVKTGGKIYWFDPTISFQRGSISNISYPDYQVGLVVSPGTTGLSNIESKEPGMVKTKELFVIPNLSGKAYLKVITEYSGSYADNVRSYFSQNSNYEILKKYKEFYGGYYEKVTGDSLTYTDNANTGTFQTFEYYTIHDLWKHENGEKKASFRSYLINSVIKKPSDQNMSMPFALTYPAHYIEEVQIDLPQDWDASESFDKIETANFLFSLKISYADRKYLLRYEYENLTDHVAPAEMEEFFRGFRKADDNFGFFVSIADTETTTVSKKIESTDTGNKFELFVGIIGILVVGGIVWEIYRRRNRSYRY